MGAPPPPPRPEGSAGGQGHGLTSFFSVTVGTLQLGDWTSCSGLEAKAKWHDIPNPGDYSKKKYMFADVDYAPVKLTRGIDANPATVSAVQSWVASKLEYYMQPGFNPLGALWPGETASISLYNGRQQLVHTWVLNSVLPQSYKGPDLTATKSDVATETLELLHEGFLPTESLLGKVF